MVHVQWRVCETQATKKQPSVRKLKTLCSLKGFSPLVTEDKGEDKCECSSNSSVLQTKNITATACTCGCTRNTGVHKVHVPYVLVCVHWTDELL